MPLTVIAGATTASGKTKTEKERNTTWTQQKITLTDIEKEKLLACIGIVAKDFEINRYKVEMELNKIEINGGRDENAVELLEHNVNGQKFYEQLEQKIKRAIENNQI